MKNAILVLPLVGLVAGCAIVVRPYVPPTEGPRSQLIVNNQFSTPGSVFLYDGAAQCTERRGAGKVEPFAEKALLVPADNPLSANFINTFSNTGAYIHFCRITIEFTPEQGKAYVLTASYNGDKCLSRLTQDGRPVPYKAREYRVPLDETGPFCKP